MPLLISVLPALIKVREYQNNVATRVSSRIEYFSRHYFDQDRPALTVPKIGPRVFSRRRVPNRQKFIEDQKTQGESRILEKYQTRDWRAGDIYTPHDLSAAEMKKWRKRYSPATDAFDSLNMNPLDLYKVCAVFKWTIFFIVGSGTPVIVNSFYVNAELLDHV